jgi:aspartate racemase
MMQRTIGVLGGMGPAATAHFFQLLVNRTAAGKDQEHVPTLVWSDPGVPSRAEAILGIGPSPLPMLLRGVRILEEGGADLFVMPCITAHYWAEEIGAHARIPFVNLLHVTRRSLAGMSPVPRTVGVIATSGTLKTRLFDAILARQGIRVLAPSDRDQTRFMAAVFGESGIKAQGDLRRCRASIVRIARRLIERGAEAIIAGCTEVPLVLRQHDLQVPLVDPMRLGAEACIAKAGFRIHH